MASKKATTNQKFIPGSDADSNEIFTFPFTVNDDTIEYLKDHGRIMFIIRGPPGTGKDSLTKMLTDQYSDATICSADSYFNDTFSSFTRDSQSLRLSHEYCHKKVKNACMKDQHPIIVKNTHMKIFELQKYLDFAADYNYTIIMAVTVRKFEATPEILAKSNTKGLNVDYFRRRLNQWEEVIPVVVGWFFNPNDSSFLLNESLKALDSLLGDGRFCRILNIFDRVDLLGHYVTRKLLYCIAAFDEGSRSSKIKSYYLSEKVQERYGDCFTIVIVGYLVTPSFVYAVVDLNEDAKDLLYIIPDSKHDDDDMESLMTGFGSLSVGGNLKAHSTTARFNANFKSVINTAKCEENSDEVINVSLCSFVLLAESAEESHKPLKAVSPLMKLLTSVADSNGVIRSDQFVELDGDAEVCRLSEKAWFIKPPYKVSFKTIYTGLYV